MRNQRKMVQRPFSDAGTGSEFTWKNQSVAEVANNVVSAITFKPAEANNEGVTPFPYKLPSQQLNNRPRAKVFKYLSAIETARKKGSLTRSAIAKIGLTDSNISHIGRLVRNPFAINIPVPPVRKNSIETAAPQRSMVNVFDNINENKGSSGGGVDDYYVTTQPDSSKENAFDESDQDLDNESNIKPSTKSKLDLEYIPVKPVDTNSTIDHYTLPAFTGAPITENNRKTVYNPVSHKSNDNGSIINKSAVIGTLPAHQKQSLVRFDNDNDSIFYDITQVPNKVLNGETEATDSPATLKLYRYTANVKSGACTTLKELRTDIDLQEKFSELDLEVSWSGLYYLLLK